MTPEYAYLWLENAPIDELRAEIVRLYTLLTEMEARITALETP